MESPFFSPSHPFPWLRMLSHSSRATLFCICRSFSFSGREATFLISSQLISIFAQTPWDPCSMNSSVCPWRMWNKRRWLLSAIDSIINWIISDFSLDARKSVKERGSSRISQGDIERNGTPQHWVQHHSTTRIPGTRISIHSLPKTSCHPLMHSSAWQSVVFFEHCSSIIDTFDVLWSCTVMIDLDGLQRFW